MDDDLKNQEHKMKMTYESYIIGFIFSLILTLVSFFSVYANLMTGGALLFSLGALALGQVIVQLVFFLHLGQEPSPPLNFYSFLFMALIAFILVAGTIWIMYHLNYQMMG